MSPKEIIESLPEDRYQWVDILSEEDYQRLINKDDRENDSYDWQDSWLGESDEQQEK